MQSFCAKKVFQSFFIKSFSAALLYTLLSAVVIAQKPVPKELDYEDDLPLQPGGGGPFSRDVPVFVNVHSHPKTGFSCADKQAGQYYADPESKCAVYYVCIANERGSLSAQSFACPNGTLFSQSTRVCAYHDLGMYLSTPVSAYTIFV
jgi:hypothetical protein